MQCTASFFDNNQLFTAQHVDGIRDSIQIAVMKCFGPASTGSGHCYPVRFNNIALQNHHGKRILRTVTYDSSFWHGAHLRVWDLRVRPSGKSTVDLALVIAALSLLYHGNRSREWKSIQIISKSHLNWNRFCLYLWSSCDVYKNCVKCLRYYKRRVSFLRSNCLTSSLC